MRVYILTLYNGGEVDVDEEKLLEEGAYVLFGDQYPIYLADMQDIIQPQKGDIFATLEINGPKDLVDKLLVQGSDEQFYGDGYEAWDDIKARATKIRLMAVETPDE